MAWIVIEVCQKTDSKYNDIALTTWRNAVDFKTEIELKEEVNEYILKSVLLIWSADD